MAIETRTQLYTYFETGDVPTADEFKNLIDSQINQASDGVTAKSAGDGTSLVGISNENGTARLNISGLGETGNHISLYQKTNSTEYYLIKDNTQGEGSGKTGGLNIKQNNSFSSVSRLFIQWDGKVGLGTTTPVRKLDVEEQNSNSHTGVKVMNTATDSYGWSAGHVHNTLNEKNGCFILFEEGDGSKDPGTERFTILKGGNVGINELLPDTKLHVSRDLSDANMPVDLREGTGIAIFGPIEENVTLDSSSIQARRGEYIGSTLDIDTNTLNIQPLGGAILVHGDDSISSSARVVITETGSFGIGTTAPVERIDIDGAIKIGTTNNSSPVAGTIRWNGSDFQGYTGTTWSSFTEGSQVWIENTDRNTIYYNPAGARVAIGTDTPISTLHIYESDAITTGSPSANSIAAYIRNNGTTDSSGINDYRAGLQIDCDTTWSSLDGPTNIGLYVSDVTGQVMVNENFAAVLNGNVVIGDLTGQHLVGTSGANVFAIQNGAAPTTAPDDTIKTSGIQLYSANVANTEGIPTSTLHAMNGDGTVIKLFKGSALPTAITTELTSSTYGELEKSVIVNLRNRLNALEAHLQSLGLLATS